MFLFALAAAAAAPHSVTGAFGYALGEAPRIAACHGGKTFATTTIYLCPGQGAFTRIGILTHHNQATDIQASRDYPGMPLDVGMQRCLADLVPVKRMVRRQYPALLDLPITRGVNFWFSEAALGGRLPTGRTIVGRCSESRTVRGKTITLWLTYQLEARETVRLIDLDKAEAGRK